MEAKLNVRKNNFHLIKNFHQLVKDFETTKNPKNSEKNFGEPTIPTWFLFGEEALKEELKALKSQISPENIDKTIAH